MLLPRHIELIELFLNDELEQKGAAELDAELKGNSEFASHFVDQARIHYALASLDGGQGARVRDATVAVLKAKSSQLVRSEILDDVRFQQQFSRESTLAQRPDSFQRRQNKCRLEMNKRGTGFLRIWERTTERPVRTCAIALAMLCIGLFGFLHRSARTEPLGAEIVLEAPSSIVIRREGQDLRIDTRTQLHRGDIIKTDRATQATIAYSTEATTMHLRPNTVLQVSSDRIGKRLELKQGALEAKVAPQPAGQPMRVKTKDTEIRVLGTQFVLSASANQSRLEVREGLVRLTRLQTGDSVDVRTGHYVTSEKGKLTPKALDQIAVNFGPDGTVLPPGYLNDSGEEFDPKRGYGWEGPKKAGTLPGEFSILANGRLGPAVRGRGVSTNPVTRDPIRETYVFAGWKNHSQTWKMRLAPGKYLISLCVGDPGCEQGPHHINVEGHQMVDAVMTERGEYFEVKDAPVDVTDGDLTMIVGGYSGTKTARDGSSDTTINYLIVKPVNPAEENH